VAGGAFLVKEGLSDRDPLFVFVGVSLFTLLFIVPVFVIFAVTTSAAATLYVALALGGLSLTSVRVLRILELLPQGVVHEGGVVARHSEAVLLEPTSVCAAIPSSLTC
jgi:hypothetical protein